MFRKYKRKITKCGEEGFTMVELTVVIVLTAILGLFSFQALTQSILVQQDMQERKEHSDDGVLALNHISRELRGARSPIHLTGTDKYVLPDMIPKRLFAHLHIFQVIGN